jgi:hypothetical protein
MPTMTQPADIIGGRCGEPCAGRWCVLRARHKLGPGTGHRATPRTDVETAAARAFADLAGAREAPPHRGPALCKREDPDLFFPGKPGSEEEKQAKQICGRCQIRVECLQWALIHREYGVWGGTGEAERKAMTAGEPVNPAAAGNMAHDPGPAAAASPESREPELIASRPGHITNPEKRDHGTTERYASGPDENDVPGRPCHCRKCADAYNAARNHRSRMRAYGRWEPPADAGPVREHVKVLQDFGIGWRRTAALAGVSPGSVQGLLYRKGGKPPSRTIWPDTRDRILAVQPVLENLEDTVLVEPAEYRAQLRSLIAAGWPPGWLAGRMMMDRAAFYRVTGNQKLIAARTAKAASRVCRDLRDQQPPQQTQAQQRAVSAARSYAAQRGWTPPLTESEAAAVTQAPAGGCEPRLALSAEAA